MAVTPAQITIPPELLPTLSLLRHHISELTGDNEALRYTFLGESPASSSKVTLDAPMSIESGLDLQVVVKRVKEVMRENEELGEMILEAGRGRGEEWQRAIDGKLWQTALQGKADNHLDSKAVIASLEYVFREM
jgi:hypothetical protein